MAAAILAIGILMLYVLTVVAITRFVSIGARDEDDFH